MPEPICEIDLLLRRIKAEFVEMPGLKLTLPQARRLWALDQACCAALLEILASEGFLWHSPNGLYRRGLPDLDKRQLPHWTGDGASDSWVRHEHEKGRLSCQ